jgi:hypothetical protein
MDVVRSDGLGIRGEETRHQIDFANPRGRLTEHIFRLTHFFIPSIPFLMPQRALHATKARTH